MCQRVPPGDPVTQGDILDRCPLVFWTLPAAGGAATRIAQEVEARVVVLTQACDLAQQKATRAAVALVHTAADVVAMGLLKERAVRDQLTRHLIYGWYFLPAGEGLPESIVDLRDLHTVPLALLTDLARRNLRPCRLTTPYREHLAQHLATTYARIALPESYQTQG